MWRSRPLRPLRWGWQRYRGRKRTHVEKVAIREARNLWGWLGLSGFGIVIVLITALSASYSVRARGEFLRIAQAAVFKATGFQVHMDDLTLEVFPPRLTIDVFAVRRPGERAFFTASRIAVIPGIARSLSGRVALQWVELRDPTLKLTFRDGKFDELGGLVSQNKDTGQVQTNLPFELWGALVLRGHVQVNVPGKALIDMRGINAFAAPRASGRIPVEVVFPPISVELPNRRVEIENIHIGLQVIGGNLLAPKRVALRTFEFISDAASLKTAGAIDLDAQQGQLNVSTKIDLDIVNLLLPNLPQVSGKVALRAEIDAERERPVVKIELEGDTLGLAGRSIGSVQAKLDGNLARINVNELVVNAVGGRIKASGHVVPGLDYPFAAQLQLEGVQLAEILELAGLTEVWPSLKANGKIDIAGKLITKGLLDPILTGTAHIEIPEFISRDASWRKRDYVTILKLHDAVVDTKLVLYSERLELEDAHIRHQAGTIDCEARFYFDQTLGFAINGESDMLDLQRLGPIAGIDIRGVGPLHFELGGPYGPPRIEAEVVMEHTSIEGIPIGHVDSKVLFEDARTLQFPDAVATFGDTAVEGSGKIDLGAAAGPTFEFIGELEEGEIRDLLPLIPIPNWLAQSMSGDIGGDFRLHGRAARPNLDVNFASVAFEAAGQPFETAMGRVSMANGTFREMTMEAHVGQGKADIRLEPGARGIAIHAELTDVPTEEVRALSKARHALIGRASGRLDVSLGDANHGALGEGVLRVDDLEIAGRDPQRLEARMFLKDTTVSFDAQAMASRITVTGSADIGDDPSFTVQGKLRQAPIGGLLGMPATYDVRTTAELALKGAFGELRTLAGSLAIAELAIDSPQLIANATNRATLTLDNGRLEIPAIHLAGRGLDATVSGAVSLEGAMNVGITGTVDGGVIQPYVPTLDQLTGQIPLDVQLSGDVANPLLRGTASVSRARLKFSFFDKAFEQTEAKIALQGDTFSFDALSATFGDGRVIGSGSVRLLDGALHNLAFGFDVEDVRYTAPGDLPLVLTGRVRVETNRAKQFEVTGDMRIKELRYTYDVSLDAMMPSFKRKPTQTRTLEKSDEVVLFDVSLIADNNLFIDNNIAKAELKADLRLTGTNLRTGLLGTVTPLRALVSFQNQTYTLASGTIDFIERYQILPRVDLLLRTNACAAEVTVGISGTVDNYTLDFKGRDANGSVRQEDLQSCLAFGFRQSEFTSTPGVSRVGGAQEVLPIGLNLLGSVTGIDRKLKEYFRIDEVRFGAGYTQRVGRGSRVSPRIILVKDIGGGVKLRLTSSIIDTDDQKLELEFPFGQYSTMNLSWGNSGDLSNDLGLDLKWHRDF